ncbi:hypothetical protein GUITHDRAFT_139572 [Guillardia theta CCMP2712]|uniref:Uncharacterized protein n=1 Tax=Guillardia theta (strain CCMP2712) TaxID=905079 RepID=L1J7W9_GUITC|nr:hypothetical protein GUITHDRAFT_139572 [Guillardia theta CCMP2712]EKX44633.1 hypothetical protein GUITHDRAFT_139572 [Guillardia theta CCMP2712]|eukprot:XP_005831613.1 hypothetical protein GUITHDRAFT_139572 [Guillardia theta CCMP2712]
MLLLQLIPMTPMLSSGYTRADGITFDGIPSQEGFWIVDSYNAPASDPYRTTEVNIDTRYGGGIGTSGFNGGETPISDGYSAASIGVPLFSYGSIYLYASNALVVYALSRDLTPFSN